MDVLQWLALTLGVLFVLALIFERWASRDWNRRHQWPRHGETRRWWDDERDGPEGDH